MSSPVLPVSRRERTRAATEAEIKDVALRHLVANGAAGLSLRAVARDLGLTAPALYRYFDDRDALITALIADGFASCADAVEAAVAAVAAAATAATAAVTPAGTGDPARPLWAACLAYRTWGVTHPEQFGLVYGGPLPGFAGPAGPLADGAPGPTEVQAQRVALAFLGPFFDMASQHPDAPPFSRPVRGQLRDQLTAVGERLGVTATPEQLAVFFVGFGRLHGLVALEVFHHLRGMIGDESGALYEHQLRLVWDEFGIAPPDEPPRDRPAGGAG